MDQMASTRWTDYTREWAPYIHMQIDVVISYKGTVKRGCGIRQREMQRRGQESTESNGVKSRHQATWVCYSITDIYYLL